MQNPFRQGKSFLIPVLLSAALLFGITNWGVVQAQSESRYFPETGHTVSGEFLAFYERASDPMLVYGYPITEAFIDPVYGRLVQYFQKARFDLFPNEPPESRVQLSFLGLWLYEPGLPRSQPEKSSSCRTFRDNDGSFKVCYAFLDFFNAHGGIDQFGLPISNLENHDGRFVQYFQKARFEWHPQLPSGQKVQLTDLGSINFKQQALDQNYLLHGNNLPQTILSLNVRAYPGRAVTGLKGQQVIYIIVQDQNRLPVANALVTVQVRSPSGIELDQPIQVTTDKKGLARVSFPFETNQPGLFTITTSARLDTIETQTSSSFRAWW